MEEGEKEEKDVWKQDGRPKRADVIDVKRGAGPAVATPGGNHYTKGVWVRGRGGLLGEARSEGSP
jgi:hypothetical protein